MSSETLPAKRLEHALTKLQDAQSALKLAAEELTIVDAEMLGSDAHRRFPFAPSLPLNSSVTF
jgi:hypothetical protein